MAMCFSASKAALNMGGKLLSIDLKKQGVIVSLVHVSFDRNFVFC